MKYKVGDKVKIKNNLRDIRNFVGGYVPQLKQYEGDIVTIKKIVNKSARVEGNDWKWDLRAFEPIEKIIKKSDLRCGDIVTYRSGDKRIFNGTEFVYLSDFKKMSMCLGSYNEKLFCIKDKSFDIVQVYRPVTEETFTTKNAKSEEILDATEKNICKI